MAVWTRLAAMAIAISVLAACASPGRIAVSAEHRMGGNLAGSSVGTPPRSLWSSGSGLHPPDLLLLASDRLPRRLVRALQEMPGVRATETLAVASLEAAGRRVTIAGVDPQTHRLFSPPGTAGYRPLWRVVGAGDVALSPETARLLRKPLGSELSVTGAHGTETLRVGAHASTVAGVDAIVNRHLAERLGLPRGNAVLVSGEGLVPAHVRELTRQRSNRHISVRRLPPIVSRAGGHRSAALVGGPLARALGSFTYTYSADGSIQPDPAWVNENIRTETVPILGSVTCHKLMIPQLRAALQQVVDSGLADQINPEEYGGCYVPRFIGSDPSNPVSLHTWGIAFDLNVAGNQRGVAGAIDPRVVAIFKAWGFAWGGDWDYTDPMHFELGALAR